MEYTYNTLDRLTGITQHTTSTTLASYGYTLDPAGNRLGVTEADGSSITWDYDDAYRLIGETRLNPGGSTTSRTTFTYDPVGNRLRMTVDGVTTNYTYNELDQLLTAGGTSFTYDARGNLTQTSSGAGPTSYSWDALDRLSDVTLPDGTALTYTYDADGRRVRQVMDGTETNYLWDENSLYGDVVLETDAGGALLASYVLGGPELLAQARAGSTSYYLSDAQGSARALTNSSGAISDTYDFTAFGELFASTGSTTNAYLYSGQQFDALTGLYSLRARAYDPGAGRFLSRDPMEVQPFNTAEINRYTYAANNPVNLADPSGRGLVETGALNLSTMEQRAIVAGIIGLTFLYALTRVPDVVGVPEWTWPNFPDFSPDGPDPNKKPEPPRLSDLYKAIFGLIVVSLLGNAISGGIQPIVEGEPLPVEPPDPEPTPTQTTRLFHGTKSPESAFALGIDMSMGGGQFGSGFYTTPVRSAAIYFAEVWAAGPGPAAVLWADVPSQWVLEARSLTQGEYDALTYERSWGRGYSSPVQPEYMYLITDFDMLTGPIVGLEQWSQYKFNPTASASVKVNSVHWSYEPIP